MARFLHIGDIHLRSTSERNVFTLRALDHVLETALRMDAEQRFSAIFIPGDLYDARSTVEDRNALAPRIRALANIAPVFIVYGNHDAPGDLEILTKLKAAYPIAVADRPCVLDARASTGEMLAIACLPYPTRAGLVAAGVAKGDVSQEAAGLLDLVMLQLAEELEALKGRGYIPAFIGHANVSGSRTSSGQPNTGHEVELNVRHLDRLGNIYKGLNHIHVPQTIAGAHYAGSICRLNYGEVEAKRVLDITVDDASVTGRVASVPVPVAPMFHCEGTLSRAGFEYAVTDGRGAEIERPASWRGAHVRVKYRFHKSERSVLADAVVLAEFAEAEHLKVEPIAVIDRDVRAPEVVNAITLADKLAAALKAPTLAAGLLEKLTRLERGDGPALLSDIHNALNPPAPALQEATI